MMSPYDQSVYDAGFKYIPQSKFLLNPFQIPQGGGGGGATGPVQPGLPSINMGGGGGGGAAYTGGITGLTTDFQKAVDARTQRLEDAYDNPSTAKLFGLNMFRQDVNPADAGFYVAEDMRIPQQRTMLGKMFQPQSPQEIMEQGYTPRTNIGILSNILGKADKFGTLPRADQAFITSQMGYSGPTVFGENTTGGSKDPFGLNVRSAFGNYAERVGTEVDKLGIALSDAGKVGSKYNATFNPKTGLFEGEEADLANQMTKMLRTKLNFYREKVKERDDFRKQEEERLAREAKEKQMADAAEKARLERLGRDKDRGGFDPSGPTQASIRASREDRSGRGQSGGFTNPGKGSYGPFMADGGRVYYMDGGLADLVDIYD